MATRKEDDKLDYAVDVQDVPPLHSSQSQEEYADDDVDHAYLAAPKLTKFYRSVFFQMIIFGCLAFVGPAMTDAINLLGGGGLKSPYLANLASSLNYAASCIMAFFGGPVINKIGIKWACVISATFYVLAGSGYYAQARYGLSAYLLSARVIGGFTNALLYVGESTAMLSYPEADKRGKYLGIWAAMRNSGAIAGGAINFGNNSKNSAGGGVAWSTYLIFIGFEASGGIISWTLSPTKKVRRYDGTRVPMSPNMSWMAELKALMLHLKSPRTLLMFFPAFYSFFYGGTYNTYLALHFSVRSRALSSLITPICTVVTVLLYGLLLDSTRFSQKNRAWISFGVWLVPQAACFIWTGVNYGRWGVGTTDETYYIYDYGRDGAAWAGAYLPYLIIYTSGYWCQMNLYWILGTFSTDVKASSRTGGLFRAFEAAGSAVTYAVNSNSGDKRIPLYVNCAILVVTIPCMVALIRLVPEKPQDFDDVVEAAPVKAAAEKTLAQEQL